MILENQTARSLQIGDLLTLQVTSLTQTTLAVNGYEIPKEALGDIFTINRPDETDEIHAEIARLQSLLLELKEDDTTEERMGFKISPYSS